MVLILESRREFCEIKHPRYPFKMIKETQSWLGKTIEFFFFLLVVGHSDTKECIIEIAFGFIDFIFGGIRISFEQELNIQNVIYPFFSHNWVDFTVRLFNIDN